MGVAAFPLYGARTIIRGRCQTREVLWGFQNGLVDGLPKVFIPGDSGVPGWRSKDSLGTRGCTRLRDGSGVFPGCSRIWKAKAHLVGGTIPPFFSTPGQYLFQRCQFSEGFMKCWGEETLFCDINTRGVSPGVEGFKRPFLGSGRFKEECPLRKCIRAKNP